MSTPEQKDLQYWKNNCEENYHKTPISVLRYIQELEKQLSNLIAENERLKGENAKLHVENFMDSMMVLKEYGLLDKFKHEHQNLILEIKTFLENETQP